MISSYIPLDSFFTPVTQQVTELGTEEIITYKQVRPKAAFASRRALRPAINGRPQCSILSTILSLHKCAYRSTSRLSVVLRIKFKCI